jgi:hypothetical protein
MFGGDFAPVGWAKCDSQLLNIASNTALFSLLGNTSGGNDDGGALVADGAGPDISGPVTTVAGVNLLGSTSGASGLGTLGVHYLLGPAVLAPAAGYGGPTPTRIPLPTSPVIEAAALLASTPPLDQRGAAWPHLDPLADDSGLDTDNDGSFDAAEIANMTNPLDGASFLRIIDIQRAAGFAFPANPVFDITWTTFPGLTYSLECDAALHFGAGVLLGPVTAEGLTRAATVLLDNGGRDYARARRN